jgi:hypothetical protein
MSNLSKVNNFLDELEFENDFGEQPILVGRFTDDKAFIGVCSIALAFVSWTITPPLAAIIALIAVNDLKSVDGVKPNRKKAPPVINTTAEEVYGDEYDDYVEVEDACEEPVKPRSERPRREEKATKRESTKQHTQPSSESVEEPSASGWVWGERSNETEEEVIPRRSREKTEKTRKANSAIPQLPQVTDRSKRELINRLKDECPALLRLVKSHPARFVGQQRTGKSTAAKLLALLRMVLLEGHEVIASTPHYEPANPYPDVFKVAGITPDGRRDYPAIRREWNALAGRVEACKINSVTTIWDEFGLQDKVMDEDEIKSVLTSCLRETMKFGEYPIFIVHGETAAFLPGSKGLVTVFLNGTVRVETIGELIEGSDGLETIRPTGKFHVTYLDGSTDSGKIPDWLTESYLLGMLGNPANLSANKKDCSDFEEELEAKRVEEAEETLKGFTVSSGLKEPMKTLFAKCSEHGDWITVREIQRLNLSILKGKTSKQIHQYLGLMADSGLGEIDEGNRSDSSVRFRVCCS